MSLFLVLSGCDGSISVPEARGVADIHTLHGLGAISSTSSSKTVHAKVLESSAISTAPSSFDLSQYNPPVGDQSWIGSCVSWAQGWTYGGWLARKAGSNSTFAPMYLYSQVDSGQAESGSTLDQPLVVMKYQGIDTWDHYNSVVPSLDGSPSAGYNYLNSAYNYPTVVTAAASNQAVSYQYEYLSPSSGTGSIPGCTGYPGTSAAIRDAISQGRPVVMALPVFPEFDNYNADSPPVPVPTASETSRGQHAVFASRYDEQGVWIQNQWGTGFGRAGIAELSWDFVEQCVDGVTSMQGLVAGTVNTASVRVTSPMAGATISGSLVVQVQTTDGGFPIEGVKLLVDGVQTLWANRQS